jgi:hypothetical protein
MRRRYLPAFGASAALHVLVAVALVWLMRTPAARSNGTERTITAFVVAPTEDATYPGLNPIDHDADDWTIDVGGPSSPLLIGNYQIDVDKIAQRAVVLFPFITPGVSLEHFFPVVPSQRHVSLENPFVTGQTRKSTPSTRRPLALDDAALQSLVDRSWSRRDRWTAFQPVRKLAETHSADDGRLPALLKKYCDENWLQPYADTDIRDPRLWVQLGLAADHVTFIGFIRRYASEHPSTRATIELLFLLDKIAQASRDTIGVLLDTDPAGRLAWTRQTNPRAYRLVEQLRERYVRELSRLGLFTGDAIDAYYDTARLAILTRIVEAAPGGYGANDARFLIGAIYWRERRADDALRWWRDLTGNPDGSYAEASSKIRLALYAAHMERPEDGVKIDELFRQDIDRALKYEQGRWLGFSYDRLRHFGYHFDTY